MSNEKKSLTQEGLTGANIIYILVSIGMIAVSVYLTKHYFNILYPTSLTNAASSSCDISSFWNCDAATYSHLSNIAGVPISIFSIILGTCFLFGTIFPSDAYENTSKCLATLNIVGVAVLFVYSLVSLGSLCPFCTGYYALSLIMFLLFHFKSKLCGCKPDFKILGIWGLVFAVTFGATFNYVDGKKKSVAVVNQKVVEQYKLLEKTALGSPVWVSPYMVHQGTEKFTDAPIQLVLFEDFECPFCKVVAEKMGKVIRKYKDQINIMYFFYPLDNACNKNVNRSFHKYACKAAYVAACDVKKFHSVHDEIYARQAELSLDMLRDVMKNHDLKGCFESQAAKDAVEKSINSKDQYRVTSTPTIILNGVRLSPGTPINQLMAIMDYLIEKKK